MVKIRRSELINAMVEGGTGQREIGILRDNRTSEMEVVSYEVGWLKTYCQQNGKELLESFYHCPGDKGYSDEENPYTEADADWDLDYMDFITDKFELI